MKNVSIRTGRAICQSSTCFRFKWRSNCGRNVRLEVLMRTLRPQLAVARLQC